MTETFLFKNETEADSDKLDIRSGAKRDELVARWAANTRMWRPVSRGRP